jgi:hypothetical protein
MRPLFTGFSFTARVVHIERDRLVAGKTGVGVNFYSYVRVERAEGQFPKIPFFRSW